MTLRGDDQVVRTRRGTRPGSSWADLTFGVLIRRILKLRDAGRQNAKCACSPVSIAWDGSRGWRPAEQPVCTESLADIVWADDVASCYEVTQATEAKKGTGFEASLLVDSFACHALELSFGPRKTAALISLRGAGSRTAQRDLYGGKPEIAVLREDKGAAKLPVVDSYKHLGVVQARGGSIKPELAQRRAAAWTAFREGRTKIFRCKRIALQRRGTLLSSLVLSKLFFGAGAWPPLGKAEKRIVDGTIFSIYRASLGIKHGEDQHISLATACALLGLPDGDTIIIVDRLRYLKQLCRHAPDAVWAAIRRDEPYMQSIRDALSWLFVRIQATSDLPDPVVSWEPWCQMLQARPSLYRGLVQRARGLELCRIACFAAIQAVHRVFLEHGEGRRLAQSEPVGGEYTDACIPCQRGFVSRAAWACHASKKHGYRLASSVMAGSDGNTLCRACGKCFSKAARLRRHLLHSSECRRGWGSFTLPDGVSVPVLHDSMPPPTLEGLLAQQQEEFDPAAVNKGLLQALEALVAPDAEQVWEVVSDFVEPLAVLRETVRVWGLRARNLPSGTEVVQDVTLMLDPDLISSTFCRPTNFVPPTVCCHDLPGLPDISFPFVLTGKVCSFDLGRPPHPAFAYPFIGGVPLAHAKKQAGFVEEACDIIGRLVQQSRSARVFLRASRDTLASIEPVPTWMLSAGFVLSPEGLGSPFS